MPMGLGFSDALTGKTDQQNQQGGGQTPIQDAIKVLSLRIPSFVGAGRGMAPQALLNAPGGAGMAVPGGVPGGLEELLRRLFGQGGMGMGAPDTTAPGMSMPTPSIVPGGQTPPPPDIIRDPAPGGRTVDPEAPSPRVMPPGSFQPSGSPRPTPVLGGRPMQRF